MDSLKLSNFLRGVSRSPKNPAELIRVCESLKDVADARMAAAFYPSVGVAAFGNGSPADSSATAARIQSRVEALSPTTGQNGIPSLSRVEDPTLSYLTWAPVGDQGAWVAVTTERAPSPRIETLLLSAARHLTALSDLAQRDTFLSLASHELKTPLTSIYGLLQLQMRMIATLQGEQADKQRSFLKVVIRQVERLNELIDGLLDVSRIRNGRFKVDPADVDVAGILRETLTERLEVIATDAGVRIVHDAPESLRAWVDPVRFEEVITNLTMNAIRYSPEGGVVWIHLEDDGERLILKIRDQGSSIPERDRTKIFELFGQTQKTTRLGGLGMGLYISRQIAQLHGGDVRLLESVPGRGNVFEAVFPRKTKISASA